MSMSDENKFSAISDITKLSETYKASKSETHWKQEGKRINTKIQT